MVKFFFKALGWQLLTDEAKDVAFDSKFQALGVEFDLTDMQHGFFTVGNTSSRKTELCATIDSIIAADCLTMGEATSLRSWSWLLFADAQVLAVLPKLLFMRLERSGWPITTCSP